MKLIITAAVLFASICNVQAGFVQTGIASWYGKDNKISSTGKLLSNKEFNAAHKTLKIGTKVRVTDHKTQKSIVVTIVDRGPFTKHRVLDLNYKAAKALGLIKRGVAKVEIVAV